MSLNCFQNKIIQKSTIAYKYLKINKIINRLYLSSLKVAIVKEKLQEIGITHILCAVTHNRPQFKEVSFLHFSNNLYKNFVYLNLDIKSE